MKKIIFYKLNGQVKSEEVLTKENLKHINGMMVKCSMLNGIEEVGFADINGKFDKEKYKDEYIFLWTWDNLDENTGELIGNNDEKFKQTFRPVRINEIEKIEAITYSNPRFGGKLTNKFEFHGNDRCEEEVEIPRFLIFPEIINKYTKNLNYTIDTIGRSEDKVYIFEDKYILKVSSNKERLLREKERVDYLNDNKVPGSQSICYIEENGKCYYLRTCINGDSLINKRFINNPDLLINVLVHVVDVLRGLDNKKCPFKSTDNIGSDFVHGDLCLPNIYVNENNEFVGFIDLDNAGLGDKWYDYAWLLWSLEYNLKTDKYNQVLLDRIGLDFCKEKYDEYIPREYR